MPRKKIIFVIVEGPSDEDALGVLFNRIYDQNSVHVHIMHYDITTELDVSPDNIVSKLGNLIKSFANRTFKKGDFCRIIHITDTDGAFIPNSSIIEDEKASELHYSLTEIHTCNKAGIVERNRRKRENLIRLASTSKIWSIPYHIYYMSRNLDHALYGKPNSTNKEKEADSLAFAKRYKDNIPAFLAFIAASDFAVTTEYTQSWRHIRDGLHSLERHTNLGLCFQSLIDPPEDSAAPEK